MLSHGFEAKVFGIACEIWGLDRLKNLGLRAQRQGFMRWSLIFISRYQKLFCRGPKYIGLHAWQRNSDITGIIHLHIARASISSKQQVSGWRPKAKVSTNKSELGLSSMSWYTQCYPQSINSWARLAGWLHHSTELLKAVLAKAQSQYIHQLQRPWENGITRNATSRNSIFYWPIISRCSDFGYRKTSMMY